jgi:50S ribosomal protein L16 3-hydroxylase
MSPRGKGAFVSSLFGPTKARAFQGPDWPERPIVHHGPTGRLPEVFRTGELSSFDRLAACIESPDARGVENQASGYQGDAVFFGKRGTQRGFSMRAASASRLFRAGLNIWFFEFRTASLEPWITEVAAEIGIPNSGIRLYAFAAPGGGDNGTDPHWDANEVMHIQLAGRKTMRLAPNKHVHHPDIAGIAGESFAEDLVGQMASGVPKGPPTSWQSVELRPGSALYFPRGYWHETTASTDSFAVGIGLYWPTPIDVVLPYLRTMLRCDREWRRPLSGAVVWEVSRDVQRPAGRSPRSLEDALRSANL